MSKEPISFLFWGGGLDLKIVHNMTFGKPNTEGPSSMIAKCTLVCDVCHPAGLNVDRAGERRGGYHSNELSLLPELQCSRNMV